MRSYSAVFAKRGRGAALKRGQPQSSAKASELKITVIPSINVSLINTKRSTRYLSDMPF